MAYTIYHLTYHTVEERKRGSVGKSIQKSIKRNRREG